MLPLDCRALFLPTLLSLLFTPSSGFFGWLRQGAAPERDPVPLTPAPDSRSLSNAPFEMTTGDERFLAEARHLDLSPLDSCHHKVIAQIHSSCTDLTEEELAKLGVSLFNCQASVEGRKTYPCAADMTLAECTADMDPDTWNAYHIVSNRARAVCYSTRQMQFKRQTEHTVNTLVSAAVNQLEAMRLLKDGQEELKELTAESLHKVVSSQHELLLQQEKLQDSQEQMESSIHSNLDQLTQEKALIASGQQQVAQLIEGITKRMENVSSHLDDQDLELQQGHRAILADLTQMQRRAQEVYSKIEANQALFLAYQNQTALYYDELMGKLHRMNQSLGLVLYAVGHMQSSVEGRLLHIQRFIGWAGVSLGAACTCILHTGYFLLSALLMTFLQTPSLPRAVLLVLVVANALSELNHAISLGFKSLTVFLVLVVAGNWLLAHVCCCARSARGRKPPLALSLTPQRAAGASSPEAELKDDPHCRITSTPGRECEIDLLREELNKLEEMSYLQDDSCLGRVSPLTGNPFRDGGVPLSPAGWKAQQRPAAPPAPSIPIGNLRRISLSRTTRHEVLERRATLERCNLGPTFEPFSDFRSCSPDQSMASDM
ncbi:protein brambleberry-like [Dermochelys coriacea]|uniref:protein brambleberry-like n=1 Tax=Dermochelys coriacea TaxID=27794 RepID=UPI0018E8CFE7|nr:protein brambleberry-like [Dermochelys coriacea]XP_038248234.1 protein brambleberry-like [Dermochelys coriacea]